MSFFKLPSFLSSGTATPPAEASSNESTADKKLPGTLRKPSTGEEIHLTAEFRNNDPLAIHPASSGSNGSSPVPTDECSLTPSSSASDLRATTPVSPTSVQVDLFDQLAQFSSEQIDTLDQKAIVVTQSNTDPKRLSADFIKSRGMLATSLGPTFRAYALTKASPKDLINVLWNPLHLIDFVPQLKKTDPDPSNQEKNSHTFTYKLEQELDDPISQTLLGKTVKEEITLRSDRTELEGGGEMLSFEQKGKSEYFRMIKGSLTAVPHGEEDTLTCFEVFVDLRGTFIPRVLTNQKMEKGIESVFHNMLEKAKA